MPEIWREISYPMMHCISAQEAICIENIFWAFCGYYPISLFELSEKMTAGHKDCLASLIQKYGDKFNRK